MLTRGSTLAVGTLYGVSANLLWGLAFLVPVLLPASSSVAITVGRYLFYGVVSAGIVACTRGAGLRGLDRRVWATALVFAFAGNLGYYFFMVQGLVHAGAPATTVIIGTLPVTMALYGNWRRREFPFRRLLLPLGLIAAGLALVNLTEIDWRGVGGGRSLPAQALGITSALTALGLWTWFGVANAGFLKAHPEVSSGAWSTLVGVGTLVLVVVAAPALALTGGLTASAGGPTGGLVAGSLLLGVVVSWGGTLLWNRASGLLPVSVAGQLIVFETIFGLTYVFVARARVPPLTEVVGILVLITGVLIGIRRTRAQAERTPEAVSPA